MAVEKIPNLPSALRVFVELVDGLPQVMASAKDREGRYLYVNSGFAQRVGRDAREIVGGTVDDFFAAELAASYAAQDAHVISTGDALAGHLELIVGSDGQLGWYLTSKSRFADDLGQPLGVLVLSVDLKAQMDAAHAGLARMLAQVRAEPGSPWRVAQLADVAGLSTSQLERLCRRTLGLSPRGLLQRLRVEHAVHLLTTTDATAGEIAAACGFYDQSSFTRQFRSVLGLTPGAFRRA
ncbi:MAG: AraC family transcriptional regulator [Candidatus Nanopelagicales bacterium]